MKTIVLKFIIIFTYLLSTGCSNLENDELDKGKTAFDSKEFNTAIQHFKKALKENYKNSEAYLLIGRTYLELEGNNYNSAIGYLEKSLKYNPNNPEAFVYLGDAYQQRYSDYISIDESFRLLKMGLLPFSEKAIEYYQKAVNLNPNYALPYYRIGSAYGFRKNEIDEAIEWYKKGIALDDNYTRVYLHLGELYRKKNDIEQAVVNFKIEISKNSDMLEAYLELAKCMIDKNEFNEAITYLNTLSSKNPNYEGLNYYLGIAYQKIDETKSFEFMKSAARLGDNNAKEWLTQKKIKW